METFSVDAREPSTRCGTCRFMCREHIQGQIARIMVCHWGPPALFMMQTPRGVQGVTQFPIVQETMFCFRHEPVATAQIATVKEQNPVRPLELSAQIEKSADAANADLLPRAVENPPVPDGT
jgi:hypothetical protein